MEQTRWNALWISDVHLGTRGCKAAQLLAFLKSHPCKQLYLVGDIIDGWRISTSKWYWPSDHNKVLRRILRMAEKEHTQVTYIPGNHDEFLRGYLHGHLLQMGNIRVLHETIHTTLRGDKLWVVHGDIFDGATRHPKLVTLLGDAGYTLLQGINGVVNHCRRLFHLPYWSLATAVKRKVKTAATYIADYEEAVAHETRRRGHDGVVCGHIHHASQRTIGGVQYFNCGDWVESCTAIAEDLHGEFHVLHWQDSQSLQETVVPLKLTA
ncbi:MAG TPA: UDP-2,3-diacylglucosamine diphosphatase [Candidatus Acidoferrum sp.]|nr:UDP-2,3-diacylglucosamine diphosphatase [Candidatus Acidoferrum sp.]